MASPIVHPPSLSFRDRRTAPLATAPGAAGRGLAMLPDADFVGSMSPPSPSPWDHRNVAHLMRAAACCASARLPAASWFRLGKPGTWDFLFAFLVSHGPLDMGTDG